jgi:hypothetical protein
MSNRSPLFSALLAAGIAVSAGLVHAQGALKPVDARIVNTESNPVPVTGTVTLGGGGVTGTLKSGDKTVVVHEGTIQVTTTSEANHTTPFLDVSDYKEVRLVISNGSCGPCSNLVAEVFAGSATGSPFRIDMVPVDFTTTTFGAWASRTYSTPGMRLLVALRATTPGTSNSVRVAVFGRAN